MAVVRWVALVSASCLLSCSGGSDAESVPLDVERLSVTQTCVAIEAGDRVVSVGPEGHLWLARADGTGRIIDVDGTFADSVQSFAEVTDGQAWDASTLSLLEAGELWTQTKDSREHIPLPEDIGVPKQFCGDPAADRATFLATSLGLFERAAGFWWKWSPSDGDDFGDVQRLARVDGACTDDRDTVWLLNDGGQLWQIAVDDAKLVGGTKAPIDDIAVARTIGVGAVSEGALAIGPYPWIDVEFEAGEVDAIGAGGDALWAVAGDFAYVRTTDGWRQIDTGDPTPPSSVWGHSANGAWLEYADTSVCHVALAEPLRISGLRPFAHVVDATANFDVEAGGTEVTTEVTVEIDDREVAFASTTDGVARFFDIDLGDSGWHTLSLTSDNSSRELDYIVVGAREVSWEIEIKPLFEQYCAGSLCHGPSPEGARVDLSTYEAWQGRAPLIRQRLLRGEMPPVDPKPPGESIDLVVEWIEGGMRP